MGPRPPWNVIALCVKSRYVGPVRKRHFTLAQANSLISRVRPRVERMMQLSVHLRAGDLRAGDACVGGARVGDARAGADDAAGDFMHDAMPASPDTPWMIDPVVTAWQDTASDSENGQALAACLYETLSEELRGIEKLGAEVKDLSVGLTVFPSFLDGNTEVLLAWTVTDAEIRTFYTPQGGFRTRKSVEGCWFTDGRTPAGQLRD